MLGQGSFLEHTLSLVGPSGIPLMQSRGRDRKDLECCPRCVRKRLISQLWPNSFSPSLSHSHDLRYHTVPHHVLTHSQVNPNVREDVISQSSAGKVAHTIFLCPSLLSSSMAQIYFLNLTFLI